jgi:hypothetical protein
MSLIALCFGSIKVLPIIGSYLGYFSTHAILFPVTGLMGGPGSAILYLMLKIILGKLTLHKAICFQLLNNLGGIAANSSWNNHKIVNLLILLACFLLFILHPIGFQTPLYTLYWLIPFAIIITNQCSLFFRSFGATWIAHAVGSIVWLYTHEIALTEWIFLTTNLLVIGERVMFALAIVVCSYIFSLTESVCRSLVRQFFSRKAKAIV